MRHLSLNSIISLMVMTTSRLPTTEERMSITRLTNARILRRDGTLSPGSLDLSSDTGRIVAVNFGSETTMSQTSTTTTTYVDIDCRGQIISPGFIDIQLNGAYGVDFSCVAGEEEGEKTLTTKDVLTVAQRLVATGTTSFCPTMVSSSSVTYQTAIKEIGKAREMQRTSRIVSHCPSGEGAGEAKKGDGCYNEGANILGMHLEGPFFASTKKGAHDICNIISPSEGMASVLETYCLFNNDNELGDSKEEGPTFDEIDIVTLAPELPGALEVIRSLTTTKRRRRRRSVIVSLGHTDATYDDGLSALSCGATFITHLYNAMLPFHHRDPGLIGLITTPTSMLERIGVTARPYYSLIVDGVHVHECAVRMAYSAHPAGCVIVTDAISAMGLDNNDNKDLTLGSVHVKLGQDGDRVVVADDEARTTLAGSAASMDQCVRRFRQYVECSTGEALLCATLNPSKVLGRCVVFESGSNSSDDAPIGILEIGAQADLVLLNDDLIVLATWVQGHLVYQVENEHSSVDNI